jgi:hypothetical protein
MHDVRLARWKHDTIRRTGEVFFNKRFIGLLCYLSSLMLLSLLAAHGGEEKGKLADTFCGEGDAREFLKLRLFGVHPR